MTVCGVVAGPGMVKTDGSVSLCQSEIEIGFVFLAFLGVLLVLPKYSSDPSTCRSFCSERN